MSDADNKPGTTQPHVFEHYCEHPGCKKWGGFGFARGGDESEWFCWEHQRDARWWQTADKGFIDSLIRR